MAMAAISESHDSIPEARILVVDDETNIVELLSVSLKFQAVSYTHLTLPTKA